MKKVLSLLVILCLIPNIIPVALASSSDHMSTNLSTAYDDVSVYYEMDGEDIIENATLGDIQIMRTVHPNDTMDVKIIKDDSIKTVILSSNYSLFQQMYITQNSPALCNKDITGSQYIHQYIGSSSPYTVYVESIKNCRDFLDLAQYIALGTGHFTIGTITYISKMIFSRVVENDSANGCYKVVLLSDTYQVLFAVDNSYYIHCYHQKAEYYKEDASRPFETDIDYYQAIGG